MRQPESVTESGEHVASPRVQSADEYGTRPAWISENLWVGWMDSSNLLALSVCLAVLPLSTCLYPWLDPAYRWSSLLSLTYDSPGVQVPVKTSIFAHSKWLTHLLLIHSPWTDFVLHIFHWSILSFKDLKGAQLQLRLAFLMFLSFSRRNSLTFNIHTKTSLHSAPWWVILNHFPGVGFFSSKLKLFTETSFLTFGSPGGICPSFLGISGHSVSSLFRYQGSFHHLNDFRKGSTFSPHDVSSAGCPLS